MTKPLNEETARNLAVQLRAIVDLATEGKEGAMTLSNTTLSRLAGRLCRELASRLPQDS